MNQFIPAIVTDVERKLPFYITSTGGWKNQEFLSREKGYPDFQWIQCVSGQGTVQFGAKGPKSTVSKGQGMLLFPNEPHQYGPAIEPWEVRWLSFNGAHVLSMLEQMGWSSSQVLYLSNPDLTLIKLHECIAILESKRPMRNFEASTVSYQVLLDLYKYGSPSEIRSKQQHFDQLSPILGYIEDFYHEPLSLQHLADLIQVSPQYTCLLFQQTLGARPFEYITKIRIRKAKELLLQDIHLEINEIAQKVGYDNTSYFIKIFKQLEGVTPRMFRKIHRVI